MQQQHRVGSYHKTYASTELQDDNFNITMLVDVLRVLKEGHFFNSEWKTLGLELGLYEETLATISVNNPRNASACLKDTLVEWFKLADGVDRLGRRPSWNTLSVALERSNNKPTAEYVRKQANLINNVPLKNSPTEMSYNSYITQAYNKINKCAICSCTCAVISSTLLILLLSIGLSPGRLKYNETISNSDGHQANTRNEIVNTETMKVPSPVFTKLPSLEDRIWIHGEVGEDIVDACISKLTESNLFPDDKLFMKRIAHVMSCYGKPPFRLHTDGGIWQVSHFGFRDTYDTRAHRRLPRKYEKIYQFFGIKWEKINRDFFFLAIPMYSAIAARLYLSNFAEPIPPAYQIGEQADYWWNIYLMDHGSKAFMCKSDFIETVKLLTQN